MAQNRTNRIFRNKFKVSDKNIGGIIGRDIYIATPENIKKKEAGIERSKAQMKIKSLIEQGCSIEKIKEIFNKEEYKKYEPYIDKWIEGWVIKLNPNIKKRITELLNKEKDIKKIAEIIHVENKEIYEKYELIIKQYIESEIEAKERKSKEEDER